MKQELGIITLGISLVLIFSFIFNYSGGLTGFAILNNTEINSEVVNITKEDALTAINKSEKLLAEMKELGFPEIFIEDALINAKKTFELVKYAEILRNNSISSNDKRKIEANDALRLIDWKEINYAEVLTYIELIEKRKDQAQRLDDILKIREKELFVNETLIDSGELYSGGIFEGLEEINDTEVVNLIEKARISFNEGRFDEAEKFLDEAKLVFESKKLELATISVFKKGTGNFLRKYWYLVIIILGIFGFSGFYSYKKISIQKLKNKIEKMKNEKQSLIELMKKTQTERFKENKISALVYKIRSQKYQQRINKIHQILPVLESRLIKKKKEIKKEEQEIKK